MKILLIIISIIGLLLTLVPSFLVFTGLITLSVNKYLMLAGTILWFSTAPAWINENKTEAV